LVTESFSERTHPTHSNGAPIAFSERGKESRAIVGLIVAASAIQAFVGTPSAVYKALQLLARLRGSQVVFSSAQLER
jgi:hypothetical protein